MGVLKPYLLLMKENAPQRQHPMRELYNALRYIELTAKGLRRDVLPSY